MTYNSELSNGVSFYTYGFIEEHNENNIAIVKLELDESCPRYKDKSTNLDVDYFQQAFDLQGNFNNQNFCNFIAFARFIVDTKDQILKEHNWWCEVMKANSYKNPNEKSKIRSRYIQYD